MNYDDLWSDLEDIFENADVSDVVDLTKMPLDQLLARFSELDEWLKANGQVIALNPNTQESRDVHAERAAIKIELNRRGY